VGIFDRVALADEETLMSADETRLVIAVSGQVKEQLIGWYGLSPGKIEVVPNGISPERFEHPAGAVRDEYRRRAECSPRDFVLLFIGNEFDRKGLETVIEATAILDDPALKVVIIGDDDPDPYRRRAAALGVGSRLRFLGRVAGPETWYSAADAFVFPTRFEPFGMVIVEAMAAGLPVITSASAGAVEEFTDGREGVYLRDPYSAEELASAVRRLRDDDEFRLALAAEGPRAARRFSWPEVASHTMDIYRGVLGRSHRT
jgi:UDP-glucose:(heptosyl)LPS alpha-1,3-glucosyltransferase